MKKVYSTAFLFVVMLILAGCNQTDTVNNGVTTPGGEDIFRESCIGCHSTETVTGGSFKLESEKLQKDFEEKARLIEFVEKNMPANAPSSLTKEEYEAVVDYIWQQDSK